MNTTLLLPEIQAFIRGYTEDSSVLAFKGSPFEGVSVQELITQIEGFRKTKKKLPLWHRTPGIYFPNRVNIEQTSSEVTAKYKASLVHGDRLADITGGLGVDSFYFAKQFEIVDHFETDASLLEIAAHNFKALKVKNVNCKVQDGLKAIDNTFYDVIYVDPARRNEAKGKVFFLEDCEPNLVVHGQELLGHCETLMIKTSPMLDISVGRKELGRVSQLHVIAVNNEVKELLWILRPNADMSFHITTVNFGKGITEEFSFDPAREISTTYATPKKYLYEPNAAIMKSGGFDHISERFGITKLHRHSHLFTSEENVAFPGRAFKINKVIPYRKNEMKSESLGIKANIATRNFPQTVNELRKKWKIKEGGDTYLFFTTLEDNEKVVLVCSKITN